MKSDQADTLRRIMQSRNSSASELTRENGVKKTGVPAAKVFTIASGKGGVGKTCLVANLGAALARSGLRVLLIDGDLGLANLDLLFGVRSTVTLEEVLDGKAKIQDAVLGIEPNLWLIPAAAGLLELREATTSETRSKLIEVFDTCPWEMDVILVDIGAGIQNNVLSLHSPNHESIVILTPEPTSLTDAYGLIKLLRRHVGVTEVSVIVNQVTDGRDGQKTFSRLKDVAARFVDVQMEYLGHCPRDEKFSQSVMKRKILLDLEEGAISIPSLELLAKRIKAKCLGPRSEKVVMPLTTLPGKANSEGRFSRRFKEEPGQAAPGNTTGFWRTLLGEVKV